MIPQFSSWAKRPRKKQGDFVDRINTVSKYYAVFDVATNGLKSKYDIINVDTLICCFNMK